MVYLAGLLYGADRPGENMRSFQTLDQATSEVETGILYLSTRDTKDMEPRVSLRREGSYVAISASYSLMEIALRLRFDELTRVLSRLRPIEGLQTTRQVGTGQAYLALGLQADGALVMRPTIVADATGHLTFNLLLTRQARQALFEWLPVETVEE